MAREELVAMPGIGKVTVDGASGGAFYVVCDATQFDLAGH